MHKREGRQQNPLTGAQGCLVSRAPQPTGVCCSPISFTCSQLQEDTGWEWAESSGSTIHVGLLQAHELLFKKCNLHVYPGSLLTGYLDLIICSMALGCSVMQQVWGCRAVPSTEPTVDWLQTPASTLHKYSERMQMLAWQAFCTVRCSRGQENAP